MRYLFIVLTIGLSVINGNGQDIEQILTKDGLQNVLGTPFAIEGSIGVNFRSYQAWNIEGRQNPLSSTIAANATIKTYAVTIPVSFIMHNLDEVDHPFKRGYWDGFLSNQRNRLARFGASPYYKWIKGHLGHRYMHFSEFTLANHNFLGVGLELTPDKWRISAMGGRLARAEPQSISLRTPNIQQYTRTGWGFKVGYGTSEDYVEMSLFSAKDDPRSLSSLIDSLFVVTPQENLAIGLKGKKSFTDAISLQFELAESALTRNANDPRYDQGFFLYRSFLFNRKTSSQFRTAADVKLDYSKSNFRAGIQYRRIDPDYRSLGTYFFNEDIENITGYVNFKLLKNTLGLQMQGGLQRNNLDGNKVASFQRLIGSVNASYQVDSWSFGANFSNFSSRIDYLLNPELDSLKAVVITREMSLTGAKTFTSGSTTHGVNFITGLQTVNDQIEDPQRSSKSELVFGNVTYSITTESQWKYALNGEVNFNRFANFDLARFGVGFKVGKSFLDNLLQSSGGVTYYFQSNTIGPKNTLISTFLRSSWQVFKQQSLNIQLNYLWNDRKAGGQELQFSELMGTIGYAVQFGYHPFDKK